GEIILYELMPEMDMSHDAVSDGIFFIECVKIRSADKCIEVVKKTVGHGDGISPVCDYVSHQDNVSSSRFFMSSSTLSAKTLDNSLSCISQSTLSLSCHVPP